MNRNDIPKVVPLLEGWATVEKALAMYDLIEREKPNLVVELGVFGGRSLIPQAIAVQNNGSGIVVGVDPWRLAPVLEGNLAAADADWWSKNVNLDEIHRGFVDTVWTWGLQDSIITVRSPSEQAVKVIPGDIDILHIDANHTELASCRDVENYLPLVRKSGFVWFDDSDWSTTQKAIMLMDGFCKRVMQVGTCILFQKT